MMMPTSFSRIKSSQIVFDDKTTASAASKTAASQGSLIKINSAANKSAMINSQSRPPVIMPKSGTKSVVKSAAVK